MEVQKRHDKDHIRRVRYHSSIVTTNNTDSGTKFENVPDLIIIYVTEFDVFNKGHVKYIVDSVLRGYSDIVNDGVIRICSNSTNNDETELLERMRVFFGDGTYRNEFSKTDKIKKNTEKKEGMSEICTMINEVFREKLQKYKKIF